MLAYIRHWLSTIILLTTQSDFILLSYISVFGEFWHTTMTCFTLVCFLPVSYFRSTLACSSSHCPVSCCRPICSTTAKTWLKKRQHVTSTPWDQRSRHLTTLGPTVTNLRATAWPPWRLKSTCGADNLFRNNICVLVSNTTSF